MGASLTKISSHSLAISCPRKATQEAWAAYVRRRWPTNCQAHVEREYDLTPGRANGVVFAHATQPSIDRMLARGGPLLALQVEALAWGLELDDFIQAVIAEQVGRATRERARFDAEARRLVALAGLARGAGSSRGERASRLVLHQGRGRADGRDDPVG